MIGNEGGSTVSVMPLRASIRASSVGVYEKKRICPKSTASHRRLIQSAQQRGGEASKTQTLDTTTLEIVQ